MSRLAAVRAVRVVVAVSWCPPPENMSLMNRRVSGPVTGLKRIPSAMPVTSSVEPRMPRALLLALEPVARAAQVLDRVAELVADLVVGRDAARDRDRLVAVAGELAVQLARDRKGANHVPAQVLVAHRALDVRPHGVGLREQSVSSVFP